MNYKFSKWKLPFCICTSMFIVVDLIFMTNQSLGQSFEDISLKVAPHNDFSEGYNRNLKGYHGDFIRNITSNSVERKIIASVARSIRETSVRMTSVEDGHRCPAQRWRFLPRQAASFVYRLQRKHPLIPNRVMVVDSIRKNLKGYIRSQNAKCIPLGMPPGKKLIEASDCEVELTVPIPTRESTQSSIVFTVQFEVLDANGRVLASRSKEISIVMHVPIIVSIGESFASGEGNPDVPGEASGGRIAALAGRDCKYNTTIMIAANRKPEMDKNPVWFEKDGHRSLKSFHAMAAKELLKDWPFVIFLSFAKSGAKIVTDQGGNLISQQIDEIRSLFGDAKIDVLLVSAGGNDVGFADVLSGFGSDFFRNTSDFTRRIFENRLEYLRDNSYAALDRQIKRINVGKILINEYPGHLFCGDDGKPKGGCGVFNTLQFFRISMRNAQRMDSMGTALNREVRRAADNFGWHFVTGISDKFRTHGYCSSQPYYVGAEQSCKSQGDFNGTMHPNERGIRICADVLGRQLRQLLPVPRPQTITRFN